jgi:hypothetical protein
VQHPEFYRVLWMGRPWSPLKVRLAFWEGMDEGLSTSSAARAAGGVAGDRVSVARRRSAGAAIALSELRCHPSRVVAHPDPTFL